MRPGRYIGTSSTGMTWGLVGVGMWSISWMRPGSPRRLLGICLLGGVFLVVSVKHLFLGDLFLVFFFLCCLCVLGLGFSFFFCCYICCVITVGFGFGFLVVFFGSFLMWFLSAGKAGFSCFFCCYVWSVVCIYLFEYTELLPGWLTSEACADQILR